MVLGPLLFRGVFRSACRASLTLVTLLWAASPARAQMSKEGMHLRMIELSRQMDAIKPGLAANPTNAYTWSLLMQEYQRISESLGGDDPAKAIAGPFAAAPSAPRGTFADPEGCGAVSITYDNQTDVVIPAGPAVVSSTIVVADAGPYLWNLDLRTRITHTFAADLDITLMSPQGTVVTLTTDNGGVNDNVFNGTIWADNANPGGQVPYVTNNGLATDHAYTNLTLASALVPEEALAAFRGENPNGTWTLTISDDTAGNSGTLDDWTLFLKVLSARPTQNMQIIQSNNTPLLIPTGPAVVSSTVNFGSHATICGLTIRTNLQHTFAADLDITVMSPTGTISTLTTDNGADNDDVFDGTFWIDYGDPDGQVPYVTNANLATDHPYVNLTLANPLVPEETGGAFQGQDPFGTWTLTISDDSAGNGGTLQSWSVYVVGCVCARSIEPRRADARASGGASNVNGVAEPGERFVFEGRWQNSGPAFSENFERIIPPVLPRQWTAALVTGQAADLPWRTTAAGSHSLPNGVVADLPGHLTDNRLDTPSWSVNGANRYFDFRHFFHMDEFFDGGVLEVSVGGGPFQDALAAGGFFIANGYTGTISTGFGSPIGGRQAWTGSSGGWIRTILFLPNSMLGQEVVFRFRAATDTSIVGGAWVVDSVALGGLDDATLTATAEFSGPNPASYTVNDGTADYGTMAPGVSNNCFNATGDCYDLTISDPGSRPELHWDASLFETLNTGSFGGNLIHVGASFTDVALGSPYYRFIETLLHNEVTGGCGPTTYCPGSDVLREQMAVFLLVSRFGTSYTPPACGAQVFNDVPCTSIYAPWINEAFALGITGGCGFGNYCPGDPVLREQMAVFLLVAYEGMGYTPPACTTSIFSDVTCASGYAPWINEVSRRNITGGCGAGIYCPGSAVTRDQMAVFLTVTFVLQLY